MHQHEKFSSRLGFLLAAIGAAVGLGNIWKFPYMLGSNGGAAFIAIYLLAIFLIATPIMIAEMILGRAGGMSAPKTLEKIAIGEGRTANWKYLGWLGIFALFFVLSFFSVIAGWAMAYIVKTLSGEFTGLSPDQVGALFNEFLHKPLVLIGWHALFMATTVFIVSRGVKAGIEKAVTIMMPTLFLMMIGLVVYGMVAGEFGKALAFLFRPDFSKVNANMALTAVGQAFFSVNVGIGALLTYAAYLPKEVNLTRSAVIIAVGDTVVALLAGLMIFPIVFANNLDPAQGPGLIFVTLSTAFGQMPGGTIIGTIFFVLVFFAALTSALSMLEVTICRLVENEGAKRQSIAIKLGTVIFFIGFLTVFSFNYLENVHLLDRFKTFKDMTIFGLIDYMVNNVLLPLGAFLYAIFVGWFVSKKLSLRELSLDDGKVFASWRFLIRYVTPVALLLIFIGNIWPAVFAKILHAASVPFGFVKTLVGNIF